MAIEQVKELKREIHLKCEKKCPGHGACIDGASTAHICPGSGVHSEWLTSQYGAKFLIVCKGDVDPSDLSIQREVDQAIDKWLTKRE